MQSKGEICAAVRLFDETRDAMNAKNLHIMCNMKRNVCGLGKKPWIINFSRNGVEIAEHYLLSNYYYNTFCDLRNLFSFINHLKMTKKGI